MMTPITASKTVTIIQTYQKGLSVLTEVKGSSVLRCTASVSSYAIPLISGASTCTIGLHAVSTNNSESNSSKKVSG